MQNQRNGRMWTNTTEQKLLTILTTENNYGIYEVITQFPHKIYFDIDKKKEKTTVEEDEEFYNKIINKIDELFPNSNMAISGSITD